MRPGRTWREERREFYDGWRRPTTFNFTSPVLRRRRRREKAENNLARARTPVDTVNALLIRTDRGRRHETVDAKVLIRTEERASARRPPTRVSSVRRGAVSSRVRALDVRIQKRSPLLEVPPRGRVADHPVQRRRRRDVDPRLPPELDVELQLLRARVAGVEFAGDLTRVRVNPG